MSKGSIQRPCNKDRFNSEFDRIFGKPAWQGEIHQQVDLEAELQKVPRGTHREYGILPRNK